MATPKHTPGPWNTQLWHIGEAKTPQIAVKGKSDFVAFVKDLWPEKQGDEMREDEMNANARLISAAPELLSSLRAMLHGEKNALSNAEWSVILGNARAAVEKAEGAAPQVDVSLQKPARVAPPLPEPSASANQSKKR